LAQVLCPVPLVTETYAGFGAWRVRCPACYSVGAACYSVGAARRSARTPR